MAAHRLANQCDKPFHPTRRNDQARTLLAKLSTLTTIHLRFFPDQTVPSFKMTIDAAAQPTARSNRVRNKPTQTPHKIQRAVKRRVALYLILVFFNRRMVHEEDGVGVVVVVVVEQLFRYKKGESETIEQA